MVQLVRSRTRTRTRNYTRIADANDPSEVQFQQQRKRMRIKLTLQTHYDSMYMSIEPTQDVNVNVSGCNSQSQSSDDGAYLYEEGMYGIGINRDRDRDRVHMNAETGHHHLHRYTDESESERDNEREQVQELEQDFDQDLMLRPLTILFRQHQQQHQHQQPARTSTHHKRIQMIEELHSMRKQESNHYICHSGFDYSVAVVNKQLPPPPPPPPPRVPSQIIRVAPSASNPQIVTPPPSLKNRPVDETCRRKIVDWCYRIVDFFSLDRETVFFALSYLERFMAIHRHHLDRNNYKLVATTALLLAIKIHQPKKVTLNKVVKDLSRGQFDQKDVAKMELILLQSLSWRIHPPTPAHYVLRLLALNPFSSMLIQEFDTEVIQSLAIFYVEISVYDCYFVTQRQSTVALAAIMNAMESLGLLRGPAPSSVSSQRSHSHGLIGTSTRNRCYNSSALEFVDVMFGTMGENYDGAVLLKCRQRLYDLYKRSDEFANEREVERARRLDRSIHDHDRGHDHDEISSSSIHRPRAATDKEVERMKGNDRYKIAAPKSQSPKTVV